MIGMLAIVSFPPKLVDFSRFLRSGSFRLKSFAPSARLSSDLFQVFGYGCVFRVVEDAEIPGKAQKELESVDSGECAIERRQLF